MTTNDYKQFSAGVGANIISQSDYLALSALSGGFSSGYAYSNQINKILRQATAAAAVLGQIIADSGVDALDDGDLAVLQAKFLAAIGAVGSRIAVLNTAGSGTWAVPSGVYGGLVHVYGGGGGGDNNSSPGGGGGGGGGCSIAYMAMTPGASIAYIVGTAGANGVTPSSGQNGGTSSFGPSGGITLTATGGSGSASTGGVGGIGAGGTINLIGGSGGDSYEGEQANGDGGNCAGPHGGAGMKVRGYGAAAGGNASWPGGGGATHSSPGFHTGFPGAVGGIIIYY